MIKRIEFVPFPADAKAWLSADLQHGTARRSWPLCVPIRGEQPKPLDVQCEAIRDAVYEEMEADQQSTLEMATRREEFGKTMDVLVLWRLVPYAAPNGVSPRGETLEVQTEVQTHG